ncbi:cytochrome P450 [Cladochytrium replicatum]|nr:cytochrome P450 [Cladochytrium replicatum]
MASAFLTTITLFATSVALIFGLFLWLAPATRKSKLISDRIKSPPGEVPILGHIPALASAKGSPVPLMVKWGWQYGPVTRINLFGSVTLLISDPEYIVALLKKTESTLKPSKKVAVAVESVGFGDSLSVYHGSDRRIIRRMFEKPFSATQISEMRESILSVGLMFLENLREGVARAELREATDPMAFEKHQMDFLRILKKTTVDAVMVVAFGMKPEEYENLINLDDLERLTAKLTERVSMPFQYWRFFKTKSDREADESIKRVRVAADRIIQQALTKPDRAETMLLKNFLVNQQDTSGEKIDYSILVSNVVGTLVAGYDTPASTLFSLLHWLAKLPGVQSKVQAEVDSVVGELGRIEDLATLEPKDSFPYVHAVVRETNRLTPLAIGSNHTTEEDIELTGLVIPKGTETILLSNVAMLKNSGLENKLDFQPERWFELDRNEGLRKKELQLFMPFGGGPHICPGRHLAMAELIYFVVMMCSEFEITFKATPSFVQQLVLSPSDLPLRLVKRRKVEM